MEDTAELLHNLRTIHTRSTAAHTKILETTEQQIAPIFTAAVTGHRDVLRVAARRIGAASASSVEITTMAASVLDSIVDRAAWQTVVLENATVAAYVEEMGITPPADAPAAAVYSPAEGVSALEVIRKDHGLEPHPPGTWEALFIRDPQAVAAALGVDIAAIPGVQLVKGLQWANNHARRELHLARRAAATQALASKGIRLYRRVPGQGACAKCRALDAEVKRSTEIFRAVHDWCMCAVVPIPPDAVADAAKDPAALLNAADAEAFAAAPDRADELGAVRLKTETNPQYGPIATPIIAKD